jgi:hypothetical protein
MSSERRLRRAALVAVMSAIAVALVACGKQGDPQPPIRAVPATTQDLAVAQQGARLLFSLSYPNATAAGTALSGGLSAVELWEASRPAADGKAPPLDPRQFTAAAARRLRLAGPDLSAAVTGGRIVFDLPAEGAGETARTFAVKTTGAAGDDSTFSNLVSLVPVAVLAAPARVAVTPRSDGILVEWTAVPGALGYNVYRRDAEVRAHGRSLHSAGAQDLSFLDAGARFGKSYIYAVTALSQLAPVVESAITTEREVRYQDRFAPSPPRDLVALAEPGRVRLVWRSSEAEDLAGYVVYRRGPAGGFVRLNAEPVSAAELTDTDVVTGETYTYRVAALDRAGNESDPTPEARASVP